MNLYLKKKKNDSEVFAPSFRNTTAHHWFAQTLQTAQQ